MKKKIGILTFQSSDNFGALLQAYGTFFTVRKLGYVPEIINYHSPNKIKVYKLLDIDGKNSLKQNIIAVINFPLKFDKWKKSSKFRKEVLLINDEPLKTFADLAKKEKELAKIIVGSDQVWNYNNTNFDRRYFLDFVSNSEKKISYAASFAVSEIKAEFKESYAELLSDFNHLSVRESVGQKIIWELTQKESVHTLDPTLLLSKEEWEEEVSDIKARRDRYLLLYAVGNDAHASKVAEKISSEENLKIIKVATIYKDYFSVGTTVNPEILEFVSLIKNSEYVVTSSFHGLAFAINLNKNFTCCLELEGGFNSRQTSFLEITELEERLCYSNEILVNQFNSPIDWKNVNAKLEVERNKSLEFLKKSLQD